MAAPEDALPAPVAPPAPAAPNAPAPQAQDDDQVLDPNIRAILGQHQAQHLAHMRRLEVAAQQETERAQRAANVKDLERFITIQKQNVTTCDGVPSKCVREWLRQIDAAEKRVPHGGVHSPLAEEYIRTLMKRTATGELLEALEQQEDHDPEITQQQIRQQLGVVFLGPDEPNVLKDNVKTMRQGRDDVQAYNRRFMKAAAYAYPEPPPQPIPRLRLKRQATDTPEGAEARYNLRKRPRWTIEQIAALFDGEHVVDWNILTLLFNWIEPGTCHRPT